MAEPAEARKYLGQPMERVEDAALLSGHALFSDHLPTRTGTLHAAILRSPHAHAEITAIDTSRAETQPGGEAIHDALFRAYFVDGVNLARPDELVRIAGQIGLSAAEAERIIHDGAQREAVDADWQRSHRRGVTGVPTFIAAERSAVGAQPYEALEQLVLAAGAKRK